MKKTKFRAWNIDKKIMVYGNEDCSAEFWDGVEVSKIEMVNKILNTEDKDYIWMSSIGFKDKNGSEVFIDDIYFDSYLKCKGTVSELDWAEWILSDNKMNFPMKHIEIMGNIHEHPHLLKQS